MTRSIKITKEDTWYVAQDTQSGVTSQGKSMDEAIANLHEAMDLYEVDDVFNGKSKINQCKKR